MEQVFVDGTWLSAKMPEGFAPIPQDELEALMGLNYDCMWGMRDQVRHMMLVVIWKDSGKVFTKLASEKALAKRVDETFAKRYRGKDYRRDALFERAIAGAHARAHGFRFSYMVEGVGQEGEVLVFKRGIRCYTLYYYTRSDVGASNRAVYEEIASSLEVR